MGLALSFFGGMAEQGTALIEEEKKTQKEFIEATLKQAAVERKKREEEYRKRREEHLSNYEAVNSIYGEAGLTEEQKVALAMQPSLLEVALKKAGDPTFKINEAIKLSPTFKLQEGQTAQQFIETFGAVPKGKKEGYEVPEAFKTGVLSRTDDRYARTAAGAFGYSLEDLTTPVGEGERFKPVATIDAAALQKPMDFDQRFSLGESKYADAVSKYGPDSKEAQAAEQELNSLVVMKNKFSPKQLTATAILDSAKAAVLTAQTPEELAAAQRRYKDLKARVADDKTTDITYPQKVSTFKAAIAGAIERKFPDLKKNNIVANYNQQTGITDYQYAGSDAAIRANIENVRLGAISSIYQHFADPDGRPADRETRILLDSLGVQFDAQGRPVFNVEVPPTPTKEPGATRTPPPKSRQQLDTSDAATIGREVAAAAKAPDYGNKPSQMDILMQEQRRIVAGEKPAAPAPADVQRRAAADVAAIDAEIAKWNKQKDSQSKRDNLAVLQDARNKAAAKAGNIGTQQQQRNVVGRWNPKTGAWE